MAATPEHPGWMRVAAGGALGNIRFWVKLSDWVCGPDPSTGVVHGAIDIWQSPLSEYPFNTVWRNSVKPLD